MREIKFRAWDKVNKLFYFWGFNVDDSGAFWTGPPTMIGNSNHKNFIHEQFTGLHDKNGNEIYRGDILDIDIDAPVEVFWDIGCYMVRGGWLSGDDLDIYADRAVIIGNIHEDPELLENSGDRE